MDTQSKIYFEKLLTGVAETKALGLHLSAGNPPILKTDSDLKPVVGEAVLNHEAIDEFIFSFLSADDQAKLKKEKEITVVHDLKAQIRFKVNIFYQKNNLSASFRLISSEVKPLAELGLDSVEKILDRFPKGVIVISGPFGSGKSTVAASIIETINARQAKYIVTIENPIEFIFKNKKSLIEQRQLGSDVKSFKEGLEFLSEENVDIVVLSEIKEQTAILEAFKLAQSGRLVIFQVNADSSIKTLENLAGLFPPNEEKIIRGLLSENLAAIVNLHLFKKIGGGNILVPEILVGNSAVRSVIREGKFFQLANVLQTGGAEGMTSFKKSISTLVNNNVISPEEVREQVGEEGGV